MKLTLKNLRFLLCSLVFLSTGRVSADWPQFRGPDGQGHSDQEGVPIHWSETKNVVWKTELPGLHVAGPSAGGADPSLLLQTHVLREMFATLRETFDLILLDTPALIPVADPTILMPLADGVILAAMSGKTTEPQLRRAREICEGMGANLLGLVVGNVEEAAPDYLADDYNYGYHAPPEAAVPAPERAGRPERPESNGPTRRKPAGRK